MGFQSTSPVRGTTRYLRSCNKIVRISIHVPRAGDDAILSQRQIQRSISIHVPRAGDDHNLVFHPHLCVEFQSTSPVRGTTAKLYKLKSCHGSVPIACGRMKNAEFLISEDILCLPYHNRSDTVKLFADESIKAIQRNHIIINGSRLCDPLPQGNIYKTMHFCRRILSFLTVMLPPV